jgi:hypothetical protein
MPHALERHSLESLSPTDDPVLAVKYRPELICHPSRVSLMMPKGSAVLRIVDGLALAGNRGRSRPHAWPMSGPPATPMGHAWGIGHTDGPCVGCSARPAARGQS